MLWLEHKMYQIMTNLHKLIVQIGEAFKSFGLTDSSKTIVVVKVSSEDPNTVRLLPKLKVLTLNSGLVSG
jgi:Kinase binding protein CGI-121